MSGDRANLVQELSVKEPAVIAIDQRLYQLVSNIDILGSVKPINYQQQKKLFFEKHYSCAPQFLYKENHENVFLSKRELFNLPLENLRDADLYKLYLDTVNSYVDKIDQFNSIGSEDFLYNSLRYYGEPSEKDIRNAHFILHIPDNAESNHEEMLDAKAIHRIMDEMAVKEKYTWTVAFDDSMIANALVSGTKVSINTHAKIAKTEAMALAHHELGVHLVTSLNSNTQPLHILTMGCPLNTLTQEGLAILSENLAGHLTVNRMKILALRVLAVKSMIDDKDFRRTFLMLKEEHLVSDETAFTITARVFRGGGFTKDYLYLQGLHLMLNAYESEADFKLLLAGKTSIDYLPIIKRLIEKQILIGPQYITPAFSHPTENDSVRQFITHAIR